MKQNPSRLKYKKNHKINFSFFNLFDKKSFYPLYGNFAIKSLKPGKLKLKQIEAGRKAIRRNVKKAGNLYIRVFGYSKKRIAYIGDVILISVKWLNIKRFKLFKLRWQKRFSLGTMHRGLVIRSKMNYCRTSGVFIRFNENAIVLVNKRVVPVSNRVYGPVLKELCMK